MTYDIANAVLEPRSSRQERNFHTATSLFNESESQRTYQYLTNYETESSVEVLVDAENLISKHRRSIEDNKSLNQIAILICKYVCRY